MICENCGSESEYLISIGVMTSSIGLKPRVQQFVGVAKLCPKCARNPGGRKVRPQLWIALLKALRSLK